MVPNPSSTPAAGILVKSSGNVSHWRVFDYVSDLLILVLLVLVS
jgi:hypothetical protein